MLGGSSWILIYTKGSVTIHTTHCTFYFKAPRFYSKLSSYLEISDDIEWVGKKCGLGGRLDSSLCASFVWAPCWVLVSIVEVAKVTPAFRSLPCGLRGEPGGRQAQSASFMPPLLFKASLLLLKELQHCWETSIEAYWDPLLQGRLL